MGVSEKLSVSPGYSFIYIKSSYSFHKYLLAPTMCLAPEIALNKVDEVPALDEFIFWLGEGEIDK